MKLPNDTFRLHGKHTFLKLPINFTFIVFLLYREAIRSNWISEQYVGIVVGVLATLGIIGWTLVLIAFLSQKQAELVITKDRYLKLHPNVRIQQKEKE